MRNIRFQKARRPYPRPRPDTGRAWGIGYYAARGYVGKAVPKVLDPDEAIRMYRALHQAIREGLVASCHDVSDGGIGVALAESAFAGGFGAIVSLAEFPLHGVYRDDAALFSETPCRFVVSVRPEHQAMFRYRLMSFPMEQVGEVTLEPRLRITGISGGLVVDADIRELKEAWQAPLGI